MSSKTLDLAVKANLVEASKADVFRFFYNRGCVQVLFRTTHKSVVVPPHLYGKEKIGLMFGLSLDKPTTDTKINSQRVEGTLYFADKPFVCSVPWESIYCILSQDHVGVFWTPDRVSLICIESKPGKGRATLKSIPAVEPYQPADLDAEIAAQERRRKFKVVG